MRYFLLNAGFVADHATGEALQKAISAHLAYLADGVKKGQILFAGPKVGREGGVIVIKGQDMATAQHFCEQDPIVQVGIQQYEIIEFKHYASQAEVAKWFS